MDKRSKIAKEKGRKMNTSIGLKSIAWASAAAVLINSLLLSSSLSTMAAQTGSIDLEEFRWSLSSFPLRVLVDMNQWSVDAYASVVHDTLDIWLASIWNYTASYGSTNLNAINYSLFFSNVNSTSNYDILITFSQSEMGSSVVGLTTYDFNSLTHSPIPPITINVTTYSATAPNLFVKDVVMHEFGHALGIGHAYSPQTSNGPELMYPTSSKTETVYPSTLDVYGLSLLYQGYFSQTIQLPSNIPYVMLLGGAPPQSPDFLPSLPPFLKYVVIGLIVLAVILMAVALINAGRKPPPEEPVEETSPPPIETCIAT